MNRRKLVNLVLLIVSLVVFAFPSFAAFPTKPVTLVIPWGAGGNTDIAARGFAPVLEKYLGQPVVISNRPGASGAIGTDYVNKLPADGYTILWSAETLATFRVMNLSNLKFSDFDPLMMMVDDQKVLCVSAKSPYKTFAELVAAIKAHPGKLKMSYSSPGASGHIQGLLLQASGLDIKLVPFGSGGELTLAVLNGTVDFAFPATGQALGYVKSGDMRALAIFGEEPSEAFPGVPPITDVVKEFKKYMPLSFPSCVLLKKGTPAQVRKTIMNALVKASKDPEWLAFAKKMNYKLRHNITGKNVLKYWERWESIVCWLLYDNGVAKQSPEKFGIPRFK
ncbi:MAG TPA: tripartite tricarboxylate transporter substrate binding protein [Bacillota bacterium]